MSGACAIVLDHKPDYQHMHLANDDGVEPYYEAIQGVDYWYIGQSFNVPGRKETRILVNGNELDPLMLAATIFHHEGEDIQKETCLDLLQVHINRSGGMWTLDGFRQWLDGMEAKEAPGRPQTQVYDAIRRRLRAPGRIPRWIDQGAVSATGQMFQQTTRFDIAQRIEPGRCITIRIGSEASDGREYGLLLSFILDQIARMNESGDQPCALQIFIDEAADIFLAGKAFRSAALPMLERHIRKARSQNIGYVIGVQNAEDVPDGILNQLNSRIIHRHNSYEQIKVAANMATEDQRKMTGTFGPGEALVFLAGSNAIVHARMRRSPFRLTREDFDDACSHSTSSPAQVARTGFGQRSGAD
jgi:hypothetical protein